MQEEIFFAEKGEKDWSEYDISLKFDNLVDIKNEIKISKSKTRNEQEHHQMSMQPITLVGVIGPFNSGKTFLLSKLSQK